jgi:hypothetical protein
MYAPSIEISAQTREAGPQEAIECLTNAMFDIDSRHKDQETKRLANGTKVV